MGWKRAGFVDRWKEAGMGKAILTFICMFLSLAFGFDSYAPSICFHWRKVSTRRSVSGLPGIRYPAAVVFSADGTPEFIIPVQKATAHAFTGEWLTAAENRSTVPSLEVQDGRNDSGTSFPVYYYSDVARASNSWLRYGMGLSYKERDFGAGNISAVILGAAGVSP